MPFETFTKGRDTLRSVLFIKFVMPLLFTKKNCFILGLEKNSLAVFQGFISGYVLKYGKKKGQV